MELSQQNTHIPCQLNLHSTAGLSVTQKSKHMQTEII